jgi:hypothetical protein
MAEEYFYQEYPKYMCHPDGRWTEVHDKNEEGHMQGEGFVFSPSEYGVETAPAAPQVHQGGFRQPGYVDPSSRGGATGSTPSNPQHVAASQAASQAEARRLQAEAEGRGESTADQAAQAEVAKLQEEAKQREEARQRSEEASRQGQPPDPGRSTPRRG